MRRFLVFVLCMVCLTGICFSVEGGSVEELEQLVRQKPQYGPAWHNLGIAYATEKRLGKAVHALEKAVGILPRSAPTWNALGFLYTEQGQYGKAIEAFEKETEFRDNAEAWAALGFLYLKKKDLQKAYGAFKKGAEIDPHHSEIQRGLRVISSRKKQFSESTEVEKTEPTSKRSTAREAKKWNNEGIRCHRNGKLQESVEAYLRAIEIDPGFAEVWINLGNVYDHKNQVSEAIKAYRKALELEPKNIWAWNNLGILHVNRDNSREAFKAFRHAVDIDPHDPSAWYYLSLVYRKVGQKKDANIAWKRHQMLKKRKEKLNSEEKQLEILPPGKS